MEFAKPVIGTAAPAPPIFPILSYIPIPVKKKRQLKLI